MKTHLSLCLELLLSMRRLSADVCTSKLSIQPGLSLKFASKTPNTNHRVLSKNETPKITKRQTSNASLLKKKKLLEDLDYIKQYGYIGCVGLSGKL